MTDYNNSKNSDNPPILDEAPPHTDDYFIADTSLEQIKEFDHVILKTTNMSRDRKKYSPEAVNEKRDKKDLPVNPVNILKEVIHFDL